MQFGRSLPRYLAPRYPNGVPARGRIDVQQRLLLGVYVHVMIIGADKFACACPRSND